MATYNFGLDFGNNRFKWIIANHKHHGWMPHGVARVPEYRVKSVHTRTGTREGYIDYNGVTYAVGQTALSLKASVLYGDDRYTADYYLPGALHVIAKALGDIKTARIKLFATHAPVDVSSAQNLVDICKGKHVVVTSNGKKTIDIVDVQLMDEPIGGITHFMFDDRLMLIDKHIARKSILVIDVGGYTIDFVPIDPEGIPDTEAMDSVQDIGAHKIYTAFIKRIKAEVDHHGLKGLKVNKYNPERIQNAILTGRYEFSGSGEYADVSKQAIETLQWVVNELDDAVTAKAGGWGLYDLAVVTGGGGGLVYEPLVVSFRDLIQFNISEKNNALLQYANIFGVEKAFRYSGDWA